MRMRLVKGPLLQWAKRVHHSYAAIRMVVNRSPATPQLLAMVSLCVSHA